MILYSNELTIVFNIIGPGSHIFGGPIPHYIRVPKNRVNDINIFFKECTELIDYIHTLIHKKPILNASIYYIVLQSGETGSIKVSEIISDDSLYSDDKDEKLLVQALNKIMSEYGYEPLYNPANIEDGKTYAINILATSGLSIIEIRERIKTYISDIKDKETGERISKLI